jgi:hypothetical protein
MSLVAFQSNGNEPEPNNPKLLFGSLNIPPRSPDAQSGSVFMDSIKNMSFANREIAIRNELLSGNIPGFMRNLVLIESEFTDAGGNSHTVQYSVMPDYLAIGSDSNFCRIPMGPITAQTVADDFGAIIPTRKLVDDIYINAEIKLGPVTYAPVGNQNERVTKFVQHNNEIQTQFNSAGGVPGQLVGGTKKDVIISNRIISNPDRVVIYGWHRLNGQPIQPVYSGHVNYYVDYSHGIRFIDSNIIVDGDTTTVQEVLKDNTLYRLLSDENGPMIQPTYIIDENIPDVPKSFGLKVDEDGKIKLLITLDDSVDDYNLYTSDNGLDFSLYTSFNSDEITIDGFDDYSIVYIKLNAENDHGRSLDSEVLAVNPSTDNQNQILIVNGFDRTSDGNTFDFIRQHGSAVSNQNLYFSSATNDAVINGLFELTDYSVVDYILGDESTADETFSQGEQILIEKFLEEGGRLFVSGSEIAWDLDHRGSSGDKAFFRDYLKADYSADAPGNVSGTYYSAEGIAGGILESIPNINFDDGSHGTFDVDYADAIIPLGGAENILKYKNVSSHTIAGISYQGVFGESTLPGKLVYLGFPFETIYPEDTRNKIMEKVIGFLLSEITSSEIITNSVPAEYILYQNYPNPFNPSTNISYVLPEASQVQLKIYDTLGKEAATLVDEQQAAGYHEAEYDASRLSSGIYIYTLKAGVYSKSMKMTLLK